MASPPLTGLWGWWRGDQAYAETSGTPTTPVNTNGTAIGSLMDMSGNGRHFYQSNATYKPTFATGNLIQFATKYMNTAAAASLPLTVYVVMKPTAWTNIAGIVCGNGVNPAWGILNHTATPDIAAFTTAYGTVSASATLNAQHLVACSFASGTTAILEVDNAGTISSSIGNGGGDTAVQLGAYDATYFWTGQIAEVLIYSSADPLASGNGLSVRAYLDAKYSLGLGLCISFPVANAISDSVPTLGTPVFSLNTISFPAANAILDSVPTLGAPVINQKDVLGPGALLDSVPTLGAPVINQKDVLGPGALLDSVPTFGAPVINQKDVLVPGALLDSAPTLGAPVINQVDVLVPVALLGSAPTFGAPIINQTCVLSPAVVSTNELNFFNSFPSWYVGNATVTPNSGISPDGTNDAWLWQRSSSAQALVGQQLASKSTTSLSYKGLISAKAGTGNYIALRLQAPDTTTQHLVDAVFNLVTGLLTQTDARGGDFTLIATNITSRGGGWYDVSLTGMTDSQSSVVFYFSGNSNSAYIDDVDAQSNTTIFVYGGELDSVTTLGAPVIGQADVLAAAALVDSAPALGASAINQLDVLATTALLDSAPSFGTPALVKIITAVALLDSAPTLAAPALVKIIPAAMALLDSAPAFGVPWLQQTPIASSLLDNASALATPVLGQADALSPAALLDGVVALATPVLGQADVLSPVALLDGASTLASPAMAVFSGIVATALLDSAPLFDAPVINEADVLSATVLLDSAPLFGTPVANVSDILSSTSLLGSAPIFGAPVINQVDTISASGLIDASPILGSPTVGIAGLMTVPPFVTSPPVLGAPMFLQVFTTVGLLDSASVVASPVLGQEAYLGPFVLLDSAPSLGMPVLVFIPIYRRGKVVVSDQNAALVMASDSEAFDAGATDQPAVALVVKDQVVAR